MKQFIEIFERNPKRVFLFDGLGALLTAFMIGVVLTALKDHIGMPVYVLNGLAIIAGCFAIYSFTSYIVPLKNWKPLLWGIMILNLFYCCGTAFLLFDFQERLTDLGMLYFVLEIVIIFVLVNIEYRVLLMQKKQEATP